MNRSKGATAAGDLTADDLIVEILSRLPVRSVCRFKCVSRHWNGLIFHPEHRKKLPQTISGFFYNKYNHENNLAMLDRGVNIYSSGTGLWSHKETGWGNSQIHVVDTRVVFLNRMLHFLTYQFKILAVDTEGRLYYINTRGNGTSKLSVWILEDYNGDEWILKYNISTSQLFGKKDLSFQQDYALIAIHPECNMIFFVWKCKNMLLSLISYDMDSALKSIPVKIFLYIFRMFHLSRAFADEEWKQYWGRL
ncbi:hypothetical protein EJB05_05574, partial [Eragrostis curvula]